MVADLGKRKQRAQSAPAVIVWLTGLAIAFWTASRAVTIWFDTTATWADAISVRFDATWLLIHEWVLKHCSLLSLKMQCTDRIYIDFLSK